MLKPSEPLVKPLLRERCVRIILVKGLEGGMVSLSVRERKVVFSLTIEIVYEKKNKR